MKQEQLNAIKERVEKATPGPWEVRNDNEGTEYFPFWVVSKLELDSGEWFAELHVGDISDAQFIANAREDVPVLVTEVERLRKVLQTIAEHNIFTTPQIDIKDFARQALDGEAHE